MKLTSWVKILDTSYLVRKEEPITWRLKINIKRLNFIPRYMNDFQPFLSFTVWLLCFKII